MNKSDKSVFLCFITIIISLILIVYISNIKEPTKEVISKKEIKLNDIAGEEIAEQVLLAKEKYNIPYWFSFAVMYSESEFKYWVNSKAGSSSGRGLMQVSDIVLKEYNLNNSVKYTTKDMYDIEKNSEVAYWYINKIIKYYLKGQDITWVDVYIAYNVGPCYFKNNKESLHNGIYKNTIYNAKDRFVTYANKYYKLLTN